MGTLNPNLISKDTTAVLNDAVNIIKSYNKRVIYPEAVLLALIRSKDTTARRILENFREKRGLDLDRLERSVKMADETPRHVDGALLVVAANNQKIALTPQIIVAVDGA